MKIKKWTCLSAAAVAAGVVALLCGRQATKATDAERAPKAASVKAAPDAAKPTPAVAAVAPKRASEAIAELTTNMTASVRGTKPYVLASETKFEKSLRVAAERLGARTIGVVSPKKLLIEADAAARARLAADGRFTAVDEFLPTAKIEPRLAAAIAAGAKTVQVAIVTLADADRLAVLDRVTSLGGKVLKGCTNDGDSFRAQLSAEAVVELASQGDVRWMETFDRPHIMNDLAVEPAAMFVREAWDAHGLSGAGQIVSTSDSGIDTGKIETMHKDLANQVVGIKVADIDEKTKCYNYDANGHGTHTAGSIAGDGTMSDGQIRGTAWGAKLYAWFCGGEGGGIYTPPTKFELFEPDQQNFPAFIHSASWGSDVGGAYSVECADTDKFVWEHPDFLPVYSAGNSGENGETTIGAPGSSKNVLTVGATQNLREGTFGGHDNYPSIPSGDPTLTASYSSRGPCQDGRIKPDIAAPGSGILSTRAFGVDYGYGIYNDYYAYDCGTSMACPLTAGAVALVREWLVNHCGFTDDDQTLPYADSLRPSAALMKAVITGGAKGAETPNNDQGWGRVDLAQTLYPTNGCSVKLADRIPFAEGEEFVWVIETTEAAPLDVQLAWIDYPGTMMDQGEAKLINDLDLTVTRLDGGDGTILYGNGGESEDTLNNLESVRIASAEPGRYLVSVYCKTVLYDYTEGGAAAVYVRGAFDPEAPEQPYGRSRIKETGTLYLSLNDALEAAQNGETIEILEPIPLRQACIVSNVVTITTTNAVPGVTPVMPKTGKYITLADGAEVCFSNVVFAHAEKLTVDATGSGVLKIAGIADLGEIRLANADNLQLASKISVPIIVDAPFAKAGGQVFGRIVGATDEESAAFAKTANYLLNKYDDECGGEGYNAGDGYRLRWLLGAKVPDAAAAARYETGNGYINYRSLAMLLKYVTSGKVAVLKSTTLEKVIDLNADLTLYGSDADIVITPSAEAGFTVLPGGDLVFSNITFSSRVATTPLIAVEGGAFTLEDGGTLAALDTPDPIIYPSASATMYPGAIAINSGTVTLRPGSLISDCSNWSAAGEVCGGGAIWAAGEGCVLNLEGGMITRCLTCMFGGAIYAGFGAEVNLSGPVTIYGNSSIDYYNVIVNDDICLADLSFGASDIAACKFTLVDNLTDGRVGLTYPYSLYAGDAFINVASGVKVNDYTLDHFICEDLYSDEMFEAAVDGQALIWQTKTYEARTEPNAEDVARIVRSSTETNYFYFIDGAEGAFASIDRDGLVIELLKPVRDFGEDIAIDHRVTLTTNFTQGATGNYDLYRSGDCSFVIGKDGMLTVDGVRINGSYSNMLGKNNMPLFLVNGGELVLENVLIASVNGSGTRGAGAIAVYNDGTFTMSSGTTIRSCSNTFRNEGEETGVGAALLVDSGTAYLLGGTITGNRTSGRSAGVCIGNEGVVHVSGDLTVKGNTRNSVASDFTVEDSGELWLDDVLTADTPSAIGIEMGIPGPLTDTNVFGHVELSEATKLSTSATKFFRDDVPAVKGMIVTNGTEALLVWATAIQDGGFVDADGKRYGLVTADRLVAAPSAVTGLIYNGKAQTGVYLANRDAYTLSGNVATNAGSYAARAMLKSGYAWMDGSKEPKMISWSIAKATYDMSNVKFVGKSFLGDGAPKSIYISGRLPVGVTVSYEGNGRSAIGIYTVVAKFAGDAVNYNAISDLTAQMAIVGEHSDDPEPPDPPEPPEVIITNSPDPIAFKSITRVSDTQWTLVVTNLKEKCEYTFTYTDDLAKGFTETGVWFRATADGQWTTNVNFTVEDVKPAFWKALGRETYEKVVK